MNRILLALVVLSSVIRIARSYAQPVTDAEYNQLIDTALAEFDAGRWAEARSHFRRAHTIEPGARTLRAIGYASIQLGDDAEAVRSLTLALAETRRALTPEQRTAATELLAEADERVGRIALIATPADVEVLVDGRPGSLLEGVLIVTPGQRELVFRAEGFETESRTVSVRARTTSSLTIALQAVSEDPIVGEITAEIVNETTAEIVNEATAEVVNETTAEKDTPHSRWRARLGWALVGLAGSSGIISLGTGIRGQSIYSYLAAACPDRVCSPSSSGRIDRGRALVAWSTGTTVITITSGATSALLLLLNRRSGNDELPAVEVTGGPAAIGIGARGRF